MEMSTCANASLCFAPVMSFGWLEFKMSTANNYHIFVRHLAISIRCDWTEIANIWPMNRISVKFFFCFITIRFKWIGTRLFFGSFQLWLNLLATKKIPFIFPLNWIASAAFITLWQIFCDIYSIALCFSIE